MFSETHIELDPGYEYQPETLVDKCMLGASIGMLSGMGAYFIGEFAGWW